MKNIKYLLVGIVAVLFAQGCDGSGHDHDVHKTTLIIKNNSSTNRIIAAWTNISGLPGTIKIRVGGGIHKGKSRKYDISKSRCDKTWGITVRYNNYGESECTRWINVRCKMTTTVVFSNLDPDCG